MITDLGIQLGIISIRWYAIIILSGALLALFLTLREAKKYQIDTEIILDVFFIVMFWGIVGARIYYVLFQWSYYAAQPLKIFYIFEGGIAVYGGIIGASLAGYIYTRKKKYNFWLLADMIAPVLLLAQAIGRFGNFVNKEAYGGVVPGATLSEQSAYLSHLFIPNFIIERMLINGAYHHPTFLYESLWNIIGFLILYFGVKKIPKLRLMTLTCSYFIWYGIGRSFIEGMRTDSLYLFADIRVSQVVSIILVIVGIAGIVQLYCLQKTGIYYQGATLSLSNEEAMK